MVLTAGGPVPARGRPTPPPDGRRPGLRSHRNGVAGDGSFGAVPAGLHGHVLTGLPRVSPGRALSSRMERTRLPRSPTTPPDSAARSRSAPETPAHLLGCMAAENQAG